MDGFRFWKQGFWKDHLQGKPYHISALYVVDLARFRCRASLRHKMIQGCVPRVQGCSAAAAETCLLDFIERHVLLLL